MMKRVLLAATVVSVLAAVPSYAEMGHMKDHMEDMKGMRREAAVAQKDAKAAETMEAEAAGVTVKATYENPLARKNPVFKVVFDTHFVDLDRYEIEDVTTLRDDKGKEYHPDLISASGSGHHRQATLEFKDADLSSSKWVEIVIEGVAGVDERVLRFELGE